jgi:hypothetical protein
MCKRFKLLMAFLVAVICITMGFATGKVQAWDIPLRYNFNDHKMGDLLWTVTKGGTGTVVAEENQTLEIVLPTHCWAGYESIPMLRGDFDIQVDYNLLNWPNLNNSTRVGLVESSLQYPFPWAIAGYMVLLGGNGTRYYGTNGGNSSPTSDSSGKLRMVRTGNTITCYYFDGSNWIAMPWNIQENNLDVHCYLVAWNFDVGGAAVALSNFMVNKGQLIDAVDVTIKPTSVNFGSVVNGATSNPSTITITSTGKDDLAIGYIKLSGENADQFMIVSDNASNQTIPSGSSCNVTVSFNPTKLGEQDATLSIYSNSPFNNPAVVPLTGRATEKGNPNPPKH